MTLPPRSSQLKAVHTSATACMICGRFATSVGIAWISPCPSVTISCTPAASSFGALSLIMPAMSDTMPGRYVIIVGSPFIRPVARFKMNWMPASTSCPAFSRSPPARSATTGRACASSWGMPVTRPSPSLPSRSIPVCKSCGPTLVVRSVNTAASPCASPAMPFCCTLSDTGYL